ncbi:mono/diheme cytochrome c family protein [Erwinia toletana]|uniref:Mono/diheme cytochrome c family protein n=1 Tax=Winslowiella toletana TaxID=92490 RepID=A0ABS4P800_9GAMM|nr:cytochrome c [Winslowiella toletana]MBP2168221.1 mono/diheme cytochrome c family protein [Winslowiella toletana]
MSKKKKIVLSLAALAVMAGIGAFGRLWMVMDSSRSAVADDSVKLADFHSQDRDAIKRGEYVMRLSDCAACHQTDFSGGYKINTPFGELLTSNITPDSATGIGKMTERDFFNAVRQGRGDHGFLYPAMPYTAYSKISDDEMHDLWAYMSTVPAVKREIDENVGMNFPYNIRLAMAGWNMLFFDNSSFSAESAQSSEWNRGKYIVDGPAHCSVCHTARNLLGGEVSDGYLQGGSLGDWYAPDISPNPHSGIGNWSDEQIADYLKSGSNGESVAAGPMAEAVEHSTQYFTNDDLQAIATYLRGVPASATPASQGYTLAAPRRKQAALSYEVNCSACHGLHGEGIKGMVPAFTGNNAMQNDPTNMIHAMLRGARAPHTEERQTAAGMPAFDWKMNDQQMADILNYVRNSWGNKGNEVTAENVAALRKQTGAGDKLKTPAAQ